MIHMSKVMMRLKEVIILFSCMLIIFQVKAEDPIDKHTNSRNILLSRKRAGNPSETELPSASILEFRKTRQGPGMTKTSPSQNMFPEANFEDKYDLDQHESLNRLLNQEFHHPLLEKDYPAPTAVVELSDDYIVVGLEKNSHQAHESNRNVISKQNILKNQNRSSRKVSINKRSKIATEMLKTQNGKNFESDETDTKAVKLNRDRISRSVISLGDSERVVNITNSTLKFKPNESSTSNFSNNAIKGASESVHTFLRGVTNFFATNFSSSVFNPLANPRDVFQECITPTNESGSCRYLQHCLLPSMLSSLNEFISNVCIIEGRFIGICCPKDPVTTLVINWQNSSKNTSTLNRPPRPQESPSECGVSANTRIVGGTNADPKAWPWMVALLWKFSKKFFCGGALINDQYVLTAAHCTFGVPHNQIIARVGEYDFSSASSTREDYAVVKIKRHGRYNRITLKNDIALLQLEKPVTFTKFARNICLPSKNSSYVDRIATLSGWGNLEGGASSNILQEARLQVITNEECSRIHKTSIPASLICAAAESGKTGACNGDSGGPLMLLDDVNRWKVVGIVSWGRRGCDPEFPAAYTRVSPYLGWITKHSQ